MVKFVFVALLFLNAMSVQAADIEWNGWRFDYDARSSSYGLALANVEYRGNRILDKVSMPVLQVEFENDTCGPYAGILSGSSLTGPIYNGCSDGLCRRSFTRNGEKILEVAASWHFADSMIYQVYFFSEHGYIEPRLYSSDHQCRAPHSHRVHWTFDFDIDGELNDQITKNGTEIQTLEFDELNSGVTDWRIHDTVTGTQVSLTPYTDNGYLGTPLPHELAGRKFNLTESGRWYYGARGEIGDLFNTPLEDIAGSDTVLWYVSNISHGPGPGGGWQASGPRVEVLNSADPLPVVDPVPEPAINPEALLPDNLLVNGGFESLSFDSWKTCGATDNNKIVTDGQLAGQAAANLTDGGCLYQDVSIEEYENLQFTCMATNPENNWTIMQLKFLDKDYNVRATRSVQINQETDFASYSVSGWAPRLTTFVSVMLYSEDNANFDSCSLTRVDSLTGFTNGGFEQDLLGWKSCAASDLVSLSAEADTGNAAVSVTGGGCVYQAFALGGSMQTYEVTCRAKSEGNTQNTSISLYQIDSDGKAYKNKEMIVNTSVFADYTGSVLIGQSAKSVVVLYSEDNAIFDECSVKNTTQNLP